MKDNGWVSTEAGSHLRRRRTRNTQPEVTLRKHVHALGMRFRVHAPVARRCTPDFVLPRWRVAVFVDGCFWHGYPEHGQRPGVRNADYWTPKIAGNAERDDRHSAALREAGWTVLRFWEHEDAEAVADQVARTATARATAVRR